MTETNRRDFDEEQEKKLAPGEQTPGDQERDAQQTDDDEEFEDEGDESDDEDEDFDDTDETEETAS
jgi:hypothetical protein